MSKEKNNSIQIKEKDNSAHIKEDIMQIKEIEQISNIMVEGIKPILQNISLMAKVSESITLSKLEIEAMNEMRKTFIQIGEQLNQFHQSIMESIYPIFNTISKINFPKMDIDFSKWKINLYKTQFKEKEAIVNILYSNTIFPPMQYIIEHDMEENSIKNWEKWILNDKKLKAYYIDNIDKWKDKYCDDNIKMMIDEIKFNFEHSNSYSVCTLIAILIEYMLKQNYSDKINPKYRYYSIRNVLNEKVFKPININELYTKFIEENLYADTKKAKEFSRHMTHGDKIEFGNMKSAMNMIFIYDFLQDVMIMTE